MNKKLLVITLLLPFLAACEASYDYVPRRPYPGAGAEDETSDTSGGGGGDTEEKLPMRVYFYKSYNDSDDPLCYIDWYMLTPLGECPAEAVLTDNDAPDPLYPHFIGYSEYSSCMDETLLWDFATDYKQSNILNLYGIWVAEQEGKE